MQFCRVPSQGFTQAPVDTHLAHVCPFTVRSPKALLRGFSWQCGINHFVQKRTRDHTSELNGPADLPTRPSYVLRPAPPVAGWPTLLRHPIVQTNFEWYRNINLFPIDYAFRPRLRGRLTLGGLPLPRKPWAFGERSSHPFYRYSCRQSLFCAPSAVLSVYLVSRTERSPTIVFSEENIIRSFGKQLKPR